MNRAVVLVLIKGLGIGGAERIVSQGSRHWDRDRFDYRAAYFLPWKDHLVSDLRRMDVPVTCLGDSRGVTPWAIRRLYELLVRERVEIVHAHLPWAGIPARVVSPVPVVYTEHNLADSYRPVTRYLNRLTYRRNAAVTAVSDRVADSLRGYPGPLPRVIPNGVAPEVARDSASRARSELDLPAGAPLVVHVGNLRPSKGHDTLLAAARELHRARPDVRVVSVGGEKRPGALARIRRRAARAGLGETVRFLGRRPDALDFVAAADVFVNPSDVEGLPLAVLEALALGRPVVATGVGGVPSVVEHGRTGLLVEAGDALALARSVLRLLDDPAEAKQFGEAGRGLVTTRHGLGAMVAAFEDLYAEVMKAGDGTR